MIKSTYKDGKHSSKIVEKLGTYDELLNKLNGQDPIEWAKAYIEERTRQEKEENMAVRLNFSPYKQIAMGERRSFNGGYLFLQRIYHDIGLHKISKDISKRYHFDFNLDSILSRLIYGRIIFPASKLSTCKLSESFIEKPDFQLQHIYRALEVIAKESDYIQSELYKNSKVSYPRDHKVLYYDCTNFFFELEQESGLKQYGHSKEHKPNPIVQMGLFMDDDGVPLAFTIDKGNTNEQLTLKPLERKILKDFELSKFVVCTDAGLASIDNRKFNNIQGRSFVTTQSIKKLKKHLSQWALDPTGWRSCDDDRLYDIRDIEDIDNHDTTFYKERWIKENDFEQRLIVTYNLKYRDYQRQIRTSQIERATKLVNTNVAKLKKNNPNDYKRFIKKTNLTPEGEIAKTECYDIDSDLIAKEETFDGFYAVCTNLEDDTLSIIRLNHRRWKIEECFRIMKSEFKARPVFLSRDDRIVAHFTSCFLSLAIYRLLEIKLKERFTSCDIIQGLRDMNFLEAVGDGYIPTFTRTLFTDALHDSFGFRTDFQIVTYSNLKKIIKASKS